MWALVCMLVKARGQCQVCVLLLSTLFFSIAFICLCVGGMSVCMC